VPKDAAAFEAGGFGFGEQMAAGAGRVAVPLAVHAGAGVDARRVLFSYPEDGGGWRGDCFDLNFWIIDFNITRSRRMVEGRFVSFLLPICIFWVK
jgi:hypothetical protein